MSAPFTQPNKQAAKPTNAAWTVHLTHCPLCVLPLYAPHPLTTIGERDVAQAVEHSPIKVWITWSILYDRSICSPFQPVVHNYGMCCPVCVKVHIKDSLLLIRKSSICGNSRFPLKKHMVTMTICLTSNSWWYENQCALEVSLNKTNFPISTACYQS